MTNRIETDVRAWLGDGRTIRGLPNHDNSGAGLMRAIFDSFSEDYPAHTEQMSVLETVACVDFASQDFAQRLQSTL